MKSFIVLFLAFIFIIVVNTSCEEGVENINTEFSFNIVDSLYVEDVYDLSYLNKNEENNLIMFYSLDKKKVFIIDRNTKKILDIPFPGISTSLSGYSLKSANFYGNNEIIIWTDRGYHFYDASGVLQKEIKYRSPFYHPMSISFKVVKINGDLVAIQSHPSKYDDKLNFSVEESNLIETFNFTTNNTELFKGFLETNTMLTEGAPGGFFPMVTYDGNKYYHSLLSPDNTVTTFSIQNNFDFVLERKMNMPKYTPYFLPKTRFEDYVIQADIKALYSDENHFYIQYKSYLDPSLVEISFSNNGVLNEEASDKLEYFLFISNKITGESVAIELPREFQGIQAKLERNLFLAINNYSREPKQGRVFYVISLEENNL